MRFLGRSLTGVFLLAVTIGLLAWAGSIVFSSLQARWAEDPPRHPQRERVFAATVLRVTSGRQVPVMTVFGEVRSRRVLEIRATSAGRVIRMADGFEEGGSVEAGQFLLRIDPQGATSALDRAMTDLAEAEAEQRDAERSLLLAADDLASARAQKLLRDQALARQKNLKERGVGTEAAVETAELAAASAGQAVLSRRQAQAQAEARVDQAKIKLSRARITVAEAERALRETEITAAFSGVLGEVSVVQGGLIATNERLALLTDPDALEVAFRVSIGQYARLLDARGELPGAPVKVALDVLGLDLTADGVIARESAAVGAGQTGRQLFARLTNAKGLKPGDFVTVRIEEPALENVARIPAAAVDGQNTVLVLGEDDRLEVVTVALLRRQGDEIIVRAPEIYGREIVAERSPLIGAGLKVRPIRRDDADGDAPATAAEPEFLELSDERRAKLIAFVENNKRMPAEARERVIGQLREPKVPARMVARIESRMGG